MAAIDRVTPSDSTAVETLASKAGKISGAAPFEPAVTDFYLTTPIARASAVMAEMSALASGRALEAAE